MFYTIKEWADDIQDCAGKLLRDMWSSPIVIILAMILAFSAGLGLGWIEHKIKYPEKDNRVVLPPIWDEVERQFDSLRQISSRQNITNM